jgi:hypothetical protein
LRGGCRSRYNRPENCDGTQSALCKTLLTDMIFVHSLHKSIDALIDGG